MTITNIIKLTYDAPDNDALDAFDAFTDLLAEEVADRTGGIYEAEAVKRTTIVPTPGGLDEGQLECVIAELEACLENTPIDYRHNVTGDTRRALITFLNGLGAENVPKN